ncbi:MAG: bifunctional glutamate N-acetyltransferase/amino-acid acetyltransferase ArgJ [Chloroflexota bacterium]|nr:bifunctional glutamate N-acetyltransferase/amino-acid acetyltransferase ArgJ [Chloroflexota bacterium]
MNKSSTSITPVLGEPLTSVPGFRAAGIAAGIKKRGGLDLALIVADSPCVAAAVFTTNAVQAAPVQFDRALLGRNAAGIQAVVINSGCANAVTGEQGLRNTETTAQAVIEALDLPCDSVLVMSTGVIGAQLPMRQVLPGIRMAATQLSNEPDAGHAAAQAIMTTDTRPKEVAVQLMLDDGPVTIAGICKGAGMIHPNMATLLALVCTDAVIDQTALDAALRYAVDRSFNCMTVDGDTSTNDTLLVLANGAAKTSQITADSAAFEAFQAGLTAVCSELAKLVARDGEGATKFVTVAVTGGRSFAEARQVGRTIATSSLVKTAIFGTDANWGRVLAAVGRSGVEVDPQRLALWFGDVQLVAAGAPLAYNEADAHASLTGSDVFVAVDLGLGDEAATVWTCDFSHEYVSINADYRT